MLTDRKGEIFFNMSDLIILVCHLKCAAASSDVQSQKTLITRKVSSYCILALQ